MKKTYLSLNFYFFSKSTRHIRSGLDEELLIDALGRREGSSNLSDPIGEAAAGGAPAQIQSGMLGRRLDGQAATRRKHGVTQRQERMAAGREMTGSRAARSRWRRGGQTGVGQMAAWQEQMAAGQTQMATGRAPVEGGGWRRSDSIWRRTGDGEQMAGDSGNRRQRHRKTTTTGTVAAVTML